jgi:hypothetical protein
MWLLDAFVQIVDPTKVGLAGTCGIAPESH